MWYRGGCQVPVRYMSWGELNAKRDNAIVVLPPTTRNAVTWFASLRDCPGRKT